MWEHRRGLFIGEVREGFKMGSGERTFQEMGIAFAKAQNPKREGCIFKK